MADRRARLDAFYEAVERLRTHLSVATGPSRLRRPRMAGRATGSTYSSSRVSSVRTAIHRGSPGSAPMR